jgi:hypothetical protein
MTTTPQPPAKPAAPAAPAAAPTRPPAAKAEAAKADPPVRTIADEQRERSQMVQDKGVETVKAEQDQRAPADKPKQQNRP